VAASSVGPYVLLETLGTGGTGEVHLAEDTRLRRQVALKRLTSGHLEPSGARRWLLHEARAAATLTHPNIAAIFDIIEANDETWIVMEYVPGQTLKERVRQGKVPIGQVVDIGVQLADALMAAHARGVVHRDLKLSNIRLTDEGKVKILDFGIAHVPPVAAGPDDVTAELDPSTEPGASFSTPAYAAPEQLLGRQATARSDIYSLGIVLFELLTGQRPYEGLDTLALVLSTLTLPPADPALIAPEVPDDLCAIVRRALAGDPEARFPTAADLKTALLAFASRETGPAAAAHGHTRAPRPATWRSRSLVLACLSLAIAIVAWIWLARGRDAPADDRSVRTVAVLPLVNLSGDASNEYLGIGVAETLVTDLARLPAITVVSHPMATMSGPQRDLVRIARDLGVTYVADGGVQQTNGRLKLTVRLVRRDGSVAWGGSYEGSSADLFDLQRQLAKGLTDALELGLTPIERERVGLPPTSNLAAFSNYAQGRALLERLDVPMNLDRAIELISKATEMDRGFALAHAALGEAYWARYEQTKDPQWTLKARAATLDALRLDSTQAAVRHSLAVIYRGSGDADRAVEELHHELELRPNSDDAHQMLGEILTDKGQIDAAVREFQQAITLRPDFWGHYDALGLALYRAGRFGDAAAAFERVTRLQPDNANGFQRVGTAYHAAGDIQKALANYQRALGLSPTPKAYANLGFVYYGQGRFAEAAKAYEQALALDPTAHVNYRNVGDVYQRLNRPEDARAAYAKAIEIANRMLEVNQKDSLTLSQRGLYEAKLGRRAEAERDTGAAAALASADGQVLYNMAVVHALGGQKEAALRALEQALTHGASASVARNDDDLRSLHGTPQFEKLTAEKH
jgi:tetratricopeptide (TPR) repeat protein